MQNTYIIIPVVDITQLKINESLNAAKTYRISLDGTKGILKFNLLHPNTMASHTKYSYNEILNILLQPEWEGG